MSWRYEDFPTEQPEGRKAMSEYILSDISCGNMEILPNMSWYRKWGKPVCQPTTENRDSIRFSVTQLRKIYTPSTCGDVHRYHWSTHWSIRLCTFTNPPPSQINRFCTNFRPKPVHLNRTASHLLRFGRQKLATIDLTLLSVNTESDYQLLEVDCIRLKREAL